MTVTLRTLTLADAPDYAEAVPGLIAERWPAFMVHGHAPHGVDLTRLAFDAPQHQVVLVDGAELLAVGLSIPLYWDGTLANLPAGWDNAVVRGAALLDSGDVPTAVSALSITMTEAATGRGLSALMIDALKQAAAAAGAHTLLAPVRPNLKHRYPLIPMDAYISWRDAHGRTFDPWLRVHLAAEARLLRVAPASMRITGTVAEWQSWTGLPMPDSGEFVIPGGLVPLTVDVEAGTGRYIEPNVWVAHPTAG